MDYITTYFRDEKQVSHEEWNKMLEEDIKQENEYSTWDISGVISTDIGEGRDVEVNGHDYSIRTDYVYDTAKELIEDMIFDGRSCELIEAITALSEEEAKLFIKHIEVEVLGHIQHVAKEKAIYLKDYLQGNTWQMVSMLKTQVLQKNCCLLQVASSLVQPNMTSGTLKMLDIQLM